MRYLGLLFGQRRYFRLDVRGLETIPPSPVLMVGNHSGGTMVVDAWGLFVAWHRHFGSQRPLLSLTHELVLATETTGRFFGRLGVLYASPEIALHALREHCRDVLVMPGGDLDTWRPFRERYRVRFSGRVGYARLALKAGVPIVPVAHAGAHHTLLVLTDGQRLAKALHMRAIARASVWPISLALPWGLAFGPLPHLPLPVTLRYRVGRPIVPRPPAGAEPTDEEVHALDLTVRTALQQELDKLAAGG
jgi:1-acyl-sn-glycerol-3-phosphate acyltransferase